MLTKKQKPIVHFLKVKSNAEKLQVIVSTLTTLIQQKKKILVLVPNQQAADFLNKYLWEASEESFIPHVVTSKPTQEIVAITMIQENLNKASVLFNLMPSVSKISEEFESIYDLEDETSSEKARLFKEKKMEYLKNF